MTLSVVEVALSIVNGNELPAVAVPVTLTVVLTPRAGRAGQMVRCGSEPREHLPRRGRRAEVACRATAGRPRSADSIPPAFELVRNLSSSTQPPGLGAASREGEAPS